MTIMLTFDIYIYTNDFTIHNNTNAYNNDLRYQHFLQYYDQLQELNLKLTTLW